jgi:uncharacterized RDD family membrane protein YckC
VSCLAIVALVVIVLLVAGAVAFQVAGWFGLVVVFVVLVVGGVLCALIWGSVIRRRLFSELAEDAQSLEGATITLLGVADRDGPPPSAFQFFGDLGEIEIPPPTG